MNGYFGNPDSQYDIDYVSRYATSLASTPVAFPGMDGGPQTSAQTADRVERHFAGAVHSGDNDIVGFTYRYDDKLARLKNLVQLDTGKLEDAKKIYDELVNVSSENQESLQQLASYGTGVGAGRGSVTEALASRASALGSGTFNSESVKLPDGTETTIGRLFSGDYNVNLASIAADRGLDQDVAGALYGQDRNKASIVRTFTNMADLGSNDPTKVPGRDQYLRGASFVARKYDELVKVFGVDGTRTMVESVKSMDLGTSGGLYPLMDSLLDYASAGRTEESKPWGSVKTGDFMDAIRSVRDTIFSTTFESPIDRKPVQLDDSQKRYALLSTIACLKYLGGDVDFHDRDLQRALRQAGGVFARSSLAGPSLFVESKLNGVSVAKDLAEFIRLTLSGDPVPESNAVNAAGRMYAAFNDLIEAAPTMSEAIAPYGGSAEVLRNDPAVANGTRSISAAADRMKSDVVSILGKHIGPHIGTGTRMDDALLLVSSDPRLGDALRKDLTDALVGDGLLGTGGESLARRLSNELVATLVDPTSNTSDLRKFSLAGAIEKIAMEPAKPGDDNYAMVLSARAWYLTNVSSRFMFAKERENLRNHLMSADDLSQEEADRVVSAIMQQAGELLASNRVAEAKNVLDKAFRRGTMYRYAMDGNGRPLYLDKSGQTTTDHSSGIPYVVRENVSDLDDEGAANHLYFNSEGAPTISGAPKGTWSTEPARILAMRSNAKSDFVRMTRFIDSLARKSD